MGKKRKVNGPISSELIYGYFSWDFRFSFDNAWCSVELDKFTIDKDDDEDSQKKRITNSINYDDNRLKIHLE